MRRQVMRGDERVVYKMSEYIYICKKKEREQAPQADTGDQRRESNQSPR
jgi:hypothetical protein